MSRDSITLGLSRAQAEGVLATKAAGYRDGYRIGLAELRPVLRVLAMACSRSSRRDAVMLLRAVAGPVEDAEKSTQ